MICLNKLRDLKCNKRSIVKDFTILLSPFAPHIAEEIWQKLGNKLLLHLLRCLILIQQNIKKKFNIQFHLMEKLDSNWTSVRSDKNTFKNVF